MNLHYIFLVILSLFIQCAFSAGSLKVTHVDANGNILKDKTLVNSGSAVTARITCDYPGQGNLSILVYCSDCKNNPIFQGGETAKDQTIPPLDCKGGAEQIDVPLTIPEANPQAIIYFVYYADFQKAGGQPASASYFYYQNESNVKLSEAKKSQLKKDFTETFENKKEIKKPWTEKAKGLFLIIVPVLIIIALLFVVYQKSFKPKRQLHAKKSVCKYNFEKNPNTLKSLDSQGLRMNGRSNEMGLQKRNSLTNLKTLQSKLKSPITESVNYESSKPITSRRGSTSSTCSSNLSFRLDASYLDVKLKDEDSDLEDNNIESEDEEKLVNNHITVNVDDNRRGRDDQRGRGIPQDPRSRNLPRNDYHGDNMSPTHPQRRNVSRNNVSRERGNDPRSPMHSPNVPVAPSRLDSAPVAPSRLDSKPLMNSHSPPSNTPNSYSPNSYSPNNNRNMNNNGLVARNIKNPNMNNQVSIDIHSPRSPNNNVKLSSNLKDTLSTDKNAVIHNASKGYVKANPSHVGNAQKTKVQYANSQQSKSNKNDSGSEDAAEVVPNHPFNQKVFSVAYVNVPENDDELELVIGDQIKFIEVYDDDWALALRIRDRKEGMVPLTCVKEYFTILNKN